MRAGERSVRESGELLSFGDTVDFDGFSIVDHVERRRCEVGTSGPVTVEELAASEFGLPIDRAVSVRTAGLSIPHTVVAYVRDREGQPVEEVTKGDERTFRGGYYRIELTAPIKLYLVVDCGFDIRVTEDDVTISFAGETEVLLGARTHHDRPAATVTTTDDPVDLMEAVSTFGSALKTTTCERSYPTLRGHPPEVAFGGRPSVPDVIDEPQTGVTIEVPPEYDAVYSVSSLAYYLGATVVPGADPLVTTDTGFVHHFDDATRGFEGEVERVLKQCFFLDCVTRTEGHYPVDLHERDQIEGDVGLDFATLYGQPLAEQLESYLDVPYDLIEPHVPRWKFTAHVEPVAQSAAMLPFVIQDLAAIRPREVPAAAEPAAETPESLGIDEFLRDWGPDQSASADPTARGPVVRIDGTDALEDVWVGDGIPVGASKAMVEAFRNRITRTPSDGDIDITVVVNDPGMAEEGRDVNEVYGSRENLPFDVTVVEQLTREELREVLRTETDFLHYIGHVDGGGFECSDGKIDAKNVEGTGVDAFFLNACDSYRQGKRLVEAGAIAGVVTLTPISNAEAEEMGKKLARLLNLGFPLYAAISVASVGREYSNYIAIGDSGFNIVQPDGGVASLCEIEKTNEVYKMEYKTYPVGKSSIGAMTNIFIEDIEYFLTSGKNKNFILTRSEIQKFSSMGDFPIIHGQSTYWEYERLEI